MCVNHSVATDAKLAMKRKMNILFMPSTDNIINSSELSFIKSISKDCMVGGMACCVKDGDDLHKMNYSIQSAVFIAPSSSNLYPAKNHIFASLAAFTRVWEVLHCHIFM